MVQIGVQLYSVREDMARTGPPNVLKRLAELGYAGVEPAGLFGMAPADFRKAAEDCGLDIFSAHMPLFGGLEEARESLAVAKKLGLTYVYGFLEGDDFSSEEAVKRSAEAVSQAADEGKRQDLSVGYHNHSWEFEHKVSGRPAYDVFVELLPEDLLLQVDAYWAEVGGADAARLLDSLGSRVRHLHIKDGPVDHDSLNTALGTGRLDVTKIVSSGKYVEWVVVELDNVAGDIYPALGQSRTFLSSLLGGKP